jgi:hypothetical protein
MRWEESKKRLTHPLNLLYLSGHSEFNGVGP